MKGWLNICKSINVIHDINKRKDKNQPPIKINKFIFKKSHDLVNKQNSTSIQVKKKKKTTLIKTSREGIYFNIVKAV